MKWNLLFGSFVLTVGLCTQGFGASLLDRMLGANNCCERTNCCEPACGVAKSCEPVCGVADTGCCPNDCNSGCCRKGRWGGLFSGHCGCRKRCDSCCEAPAPVCGTPAPAPCEQPCPTYSNGCCDRGCHRKSLRGLFGGRCCKDRCEPTCGVVDRCAPACDVAPRDCCDTGCADNCCRSKRCGGCLDGCHGGLLSRLFSCHRKRCCDSGCCDYGCTAPAYGCGPAAAPAAPNGAVEEGDDVPPAPMVDPSAFLPSPRVIKASNVR